MARGSGELKKAQTLEDVVSEIRVVQEAIRRYQKGDISGLGTQSYAEALQRLRYLRVKQTQFKKKSV